MKHGYTIGELLITVAFFAVVATLAARALEVDASRPPVTNSAVRAAECAEGADILRRSDSAWCDPDDPIWRTAASVTVYSDGAYVVNDARDPVPGALPEKSRP